MNPFKFIVLPVFILSFAIGVLLVYITVPKTKKIFVYPTPLNYDKIQYRDILGNCFDFVQEEVACPTDKEKITVIPPQG